MHQRYFFLILISLSVPCRPQDGAILDMDRPYTLKNQSPSKLESEYHRMIESGGSRSYIFPRPCFSTLDSSRVCEDRSKWHFSEPQGTRRLSFSPVMGYEFRQLTEFGQAIDAGIIASGYNGPLAFNLDARLFTEMHEEFLQESYDREPVNRQDEEVSGSLDYSSYSRYRSYLSYDWSWGRLAVARDVAHWGPGQYQNLSFGQQAVPFNQLTFSTSLGPVSVISLYGQLSSSRNWETDTTTNRRSIFAHRYEWRATRDLLLSLNEQLVLSKVGSPFSFAPIVPLFITKTDEKEALNNGNLSVDVSWRVPGMGHVYSEFYLDDMQSPTSLFDDNWGNKWAWMFGTHWIYDWQNWKTGLVAEYSRIEPWVYTHYTRNTSQTAHFDYPLGNQAGPNSQSITLKMYGRSGRTWYFSGLIDLLWKGTDLGSSLDDENRVLLRKEFLAGVDKPELSFTPVASWNREWVTFEIQGELGRRTGMIARVQLQY